MKRSNTTTKSSYKELSMTFIGKAVGSYLVALGVDNMQPRYIDFQRTRLGYFTDFVTAKNPEYQVSDLCRDDLRSYLAYLQAKT